MESILKNKGKVDYLANYLSEDQADQFLEVFSREIKWKQEPIKIFGNWVMQPRLTSWYGDEKARYRYSGIDLNPLPWHPYLLALREKLSKDFSYSFNSALLNLYRDESDSMGWHRDNEKELGKDPVIASLSFGESRVLCFRQYKNHQEKVSCLLSHGSLLFMSCQTQTHWQHCLKKESKKCGLRINITFRKVFHP